MRPSDIEDILPPEKIAFIAYNVGIFESVQKFGNLITSGKITGGMDPAKVAEFLAETHAFYDAEMIARAYQRDVHAEGEHEPSPPNGWEGYSKPSRLCH